MSDTPLTSDQTHRLRDLIEMLEKVYAEHGNCPIVYHDQGTACIFDNPARDMLTVDPNGVLLFGGFRDCADRWVNMC